MHCHRKFAVILFTLPLLHGCSGIRSVDIEADNTNVLFPELAVSKELHEMQSSSGRRSIGRLTLGAAGASETFDQHLDAYDRIELEEFEVVGPDDVHGEFDLALGHLRYEREMIGSNGVVGWHWGVGLGFADLNLELEGGGRNMELTQFDTGPNGVIGFNWYVTPYLTFELQGGLYTGLAGRDSALTQRVMFTVTPTPVLDLFVGWRRWYYEYLGDDDVSDVNLILSGPTAGLALRF